MPASGRNPKIPWDRYTDGPGDSRGVRGPAPLTGWTMLDTALAPWPSYSEEEVEAASRVLRSNRVNYWTGREGRAFEEEFAALVGVEHAVAVTNGTVALDLALLAAGVGSGDEVVVTPRSFIASASAVVNAGATPVFADVDLDTQNITADTISSVLTPRTRAVICVHLAGWPCEMDRIMELANREGLTVIEDCAQAHGARYRGRNVGSIGHVAAWSFCQDKIITTAGEGGMITTNDRRMWERIWSFKDHGKSWEAVYEREHPPGFRWVHESFGTNWRLTEIQSAIGRIQLRRLAEWSAARRSNAEALAETCRPYASIRVPSVPTHVDHAYYRLFLFVRPEKLGPGWSRDRMVEAIKAKGIPCYPEGICPEIYREAAFVGTGYRPAERLPNARTLGETSLTFLVHPTITEAQMKAVCEGLGAVVEEATGPDSGPRAGRGATVRVATTSG